MLPSSAPRMMEYKPTLRARLLTSWSINRASSSAPYMKEYKPSYHARLPTARLALRPRECAHSTLREPGGSPRVPVALCPAAERGGPERLGSLRGRRQGRTVQAAPLLERGHARRPLRSIPPQVKQGPSRAAPRLALRCVRGHEAGGGRRGTEVQPARPLREGKHLSTTRRALKAGVRPSRAQPRWGLGCSSCTSHALVCSTISCSTPTPT